MSKSSPEILQEAIDRLAALATIDEIEEYLVSGGYTLNATRGAFYCPVANYLNDALGLLRPNSILLDKCVGVGTVATYFGCDDGTAEISLPSNVEAYINRYDSSG